MIPDPPVAVAEAVDPAVSGASYPEYLASSALKVFVAGGSSSPKVNVGLLVAAGALRACVNARCRPCSFFRSVTTATPTQTARVSSDNTMPRTIPTVDFEDVSSASSPPPVLLAGLLPAAGSALLVLPFGSPGALSAPGPRPAAPPSSGPVAAFVVV